MHAMPNLITIFKRLLLGAALLIVVGILAVAILMLWMQATIFVWGNYGPETMMYWLLGCALFVALMLVLIW